jgi:hypothetical protein
MKKQNPFARRTVNVGTAGETPKKYIPVTNNFTPGLDEIPEEVEHHNILSASDFLSKNRPKTGRGKSNPTPEEFFDYVVPSPAQKRLETNMLALDHAKSGFGIDGEAASKRHDISDNYLLGLNLEGISHQKQIGLLGCWLFGSALKI